MRTTLTLDDDVVALLRREMRRSGKSLKEVVNETVRDGFARRAAMAGIAPYVVRARALGVKPGLDYSDVAGLLELTD